MILYDRITDRQGIMPESQVVEIWRDCLPGHRELITEDGEMVRVVYPGRRNGDGGADFVDAVLATDRGLMLGDIEIHVKSSGWHNHKHYLDPAYNQVIMHVVYRNDIAGDIKLHNGRSVPTVALDRLPEMKTRQHGSGGYLPCHHTIRRLMIESIGDCLDVAGEERFHARTGKFREMPSEPGQALYEGVMTALGYTKNKHQFLELAQHVPLYTLKSVTSPDTSDDEYLAFLQSGLLGTAGLLPSQCPRPLMVYTYPEKWVKKLEKIWSSTAGTAIFSTGDWHVSRIRPGNLPVRRIAAMSYLLVRYRKSGLLRELMEMLSRVNTEKCYAGIESSLMVDAAGYWAKHLDFHLPVKGIAPALLGRGRAADIVINILLPFSAANVSENNALEIYRRYPRLATNTLEKHMMRQLGIDRRLVNSARRQQGLIQIYRTLCSQGKCNVCPLNS